MQDLTPVGLSKDGTRLVLASATGEQFTVPVDTRLRAALRGDTAPNRQWETKMESALRPRDIQARIRAGESPEDVAAAAQTTVEAIMPFAGPVIAERQHVARNALKGSLRRRTGETTTAARTLGEAAETYFAQHSLHDEDVEWDAWRRPDGRWALVASYHVDGRPRNAEFTHDQAGRYVVADNDVARLLTGELTTPGTPAPAAGRRLSPVPDQDELPLGDDAIQLVRDPVVEPVAEPASSADVDPAAELGADPTAGRADADWLAGTPTPSAEDVPLLDEPADQVETQPAAEPAADPDSDPDSEPAAEVAPEPEPEPEQEAEADREAPQGGKQSRRKGRSSVPSWDEIMFGGSARED